MSVEHWWNDTDRGKPKCWEKNVYQCHESYMAWPAIELGTLRWEAGN